MQTAVQMLIESVKYWNIKIDCPNLYKAICEQALEIEMQQIKLAWENGALPNFIKEHLSSRDYFEQNYKNHEDETF
jgi:hypothetical protein